MPPCHIALLWSEPPWPFNRLLTPRPVLSNKKAGRDFYVTQQSFSISYGQRLGGESLRLGGKPSNSGHRCGQNDRLPSRATQSSPSPTRIATSPDDLVLDQVQPTAFKMVRGGRTVACQVVPRQGHGSFAALLICCVIRKGPFIKGFSLAKHTCATKGHGYA
jgi:hypothetical protein